MFNKLVINFFIRVIFTTRLHDVSRTSKQAITTLRNGEKKNEKKTIRFRARLED